MTVTVMWELKVSFELIFSDNLSEDQRTQFDIKNRNKMSKCLSIVDAVVDSLTDKELRLQDLHKLAPHFEKLIDCIALLKSYKDRVPSIRETFENGLAKRRKYMEFRAQFNGFWAACSLSVTGTILFVFAISIPVYPQFA